MLPAPRPAFRAALVFVVFACASSAHLPSAQAAATHDAARLERQLAEVIRPLLARQCMGCHGPQNPKADLDLSRFTSLESVIAGHQRWDAVAEAVRAKEMPPQKSTLHPSDAERATLIAFVADVRALEAARNAGDPGPVLARRLSNAEYDYTIRDLTGVDLHPTREFPVDPANPSGFDNSGESLAMSPALLQKYLEAAREVAAHVVFKPDGLAFAPHPVVTETDRDKYALRAIIDFYQRQPTDFARYFEAAWRHRHRAALGEPRATVADVAAAAGVNARYLARIVAALGEPQPALGPLGRVQLAFRALPAPTTAGETPAAVRDACAKLRDQVVGVREAIAKRWKNLQLKAVATGAQPFILWKNTQLAQHRTSYDPGRLWVVQPGDTPAKVGRARAAVASAAFATMTEGVFGPALGAAFPRDAFTALIARASEPDPALAVPAEPRARHRHEAAFARFARLFPDAFYVSERGRMHLDRSKEKADKGRWLSAGFHNMFGYFRDDRPLYQELLDARGRRELDRLWRELDYITNAPKRQHADFIFYERAEPPRTIKGPEFDFIRSEDKRSASPALIRRLAKVYVGKARQSLAESTGDAHAIGVLERFFVDVEANIRRVETEHARAVPSHLDALVRFAERAYRRPLAPRDRDELLAFYRRTKAELLGDDGDPEAAHEEALRDAVASVLVSPHFLYRVDLVSGAGVQPLDDHALASRLSYFLWSSAPDQRLLQLARAGSLRRPETLVSEARRMLQDERARALAVEFAGNWLDFRRFEEHNSVDRQRFPSFDGALRTAMFEEPIRFFSDVITRDRSVLDLLFADDTFVNAPLAKHYGMPAVDSGAWMHVADARRYGRGGLLPMAVFLTKNAPGLRTSPVKRGYWVVRRALGEVIPPPPAQVPDLPNDEKDMGALTLREVLEQHRKDPACAGCHARFDAFGLAFEGYGPIGERRTRDLGGRAVDTHASFPGGDTGEGIAGLRAYLGQRRVGDFLDNLTRKLTAYALGRGLQLSDESLIAELGDRLSRNGNRFSVLVDGIVASPQFRSKRGRDAVASLEKIEETRR